MPRHLIISDVHENITALEMALQKAETLGGFEDIWCLGDVVGHHDYEANRDDGANYLACLKLLKAQEGVIIRGNWEQWLLSEDEDRPISKAGEEYTNLLKKRYKQIKTAKLLPYVKSWPLGKVIGDFTLVHGSPYACNYNGQEEIPEETYLENDKSECIKTIFEKSHVLTKHMLFGHTHDPGYFHYNGRRADWQFCIPVIDEPIICEFETIYQIQYAINPGSIGDGRQAGGSTATILETTNEHLRLIFFKIT